MTSPTSPIYTPKTTLRHITSVKPAALTLTGARSVVRDLSHTLSDTQILRIIALIGPEVLITEEGPGVFLPESMLLSGADSEICLGWDDVEEIGPDPDFVHDFGEPNHYS